MWSEQYAWVRRLASYQRHCQDVWEDVALAGVPRPCGRRRARMTVRLRDGKFEVWTLEARGTLRTLRRGKWVTLPGESCVIVERRRWTPWR